MLDDYALVFWSLLAGLLIAILLYLKFGRNSNDNDEDEVPNLFERINSMKAEESSVIRPRLLSTNSQVCLHYFFRETGNSKKNQRK